MKRFPLILAFSALILSVSCSKEGDTKQRDETGEKKKVKVVKAMSANMPRSIEVSGTLAAEEEIILSVKVPGRVQTVHVDLGSPVKRGQALLRLEPADFQLRVQQAEAAYQQARVRLGLDPEGKEEGNGLNVEGTGVVRQAKAVLEEAKLTKERMEELSKDGLVAKSQVDDAKAQYQVAEARYQDAVEEVRARQALLIQRRAELDISRKQMSDSVLTSPAEGVVQEKRVTAGQFVASGDAVLTLVRIHPLRLKLAVPERDSSNVRAGQRVEIRVEGDANRVHSGLLARVSPAISADNRTLTVEAEIGNEQGVLRPGSFARAEIITESNQPVVLIPASSVITFAGLTKVISVENNETQEKRVKLGRNSKGSVEVVEGINAGETVVLDPSNLASGEKIVPIW
ncbi:efflux RND transporter periplasmic adaptor subunit [bacterium]|nr:efflux RND transporter periplasmic adaptor subunit [bacterium]MCI0602821.1 efflux RND transporter periplasmic adaptor subunit [bacterium]